MPIYEYLCKKCDHKFETLVLGGRAPTCEKCGALDLERLLSLPYVKSEITKDRAMKAARKRDKAQGTERVQEQLRYERSHDD
jgi:putative FmdB family regulatory protein